MAKIRNKRNKISNIWFLFISACGEPILKVLDAFQGISGRQVDL
jgi:hypothetical protein